MKNVKKTPIYESHQQHGGKLVEFAGHLLPLSFAKMVDEHKQVRSSAGLFDVSHMARLRVCGADARSFVDHLTVNNVAKLKVGRGHYSVLCYPTGGAVDDLTVFCRAEDEFQLVVNGSRHEVVWQWLNEQRSGDVELIDRTAGTALIAFQGPKCLPLIEKALGKSLGDLKLFGFFDTELHGIPVTLSRCGYTGEDGFEIECPAAQANELWSSLLSSGKPGDVKPIGLAARDTLRLEMGYMLYGNDLTESITPLEAGLQWVVKLNGDDFIGKAALLQQKERGLERVLVGLKGDKRVIPRKGYKLFAADQEVGVVCSGGFSPSLDQGIGMAYVGTAFQGEPKLKMEIRGSLQDIDLASPPFININR